MEIKYLFVHFTRSPQKTTTFEDVDNWHRQKNWKCIGYNYFINGNGEGKIGREDSLQGAHTRGCNHFSLGVSLALNIGENPTKDQIKTLVEWLTDKCKKYNISTDNILGHRDAYIMKLAKSATKTDCPGDILYNMLPDIRNSVDYNLIVSEKPINNLINIKNSIDIDKSMENKENIKSKTILEIIIELILKILK